MSEAPDLIAPLIGYRTWNVYPSHRLCSPIRRTVWPTTDHEARCLRCERNGCEVPNAGCSCGIYAHYRPGRRRAMATTRVWGAVAMEGVCLLHAAGLRSARARIVALRVPDGTSAATFEGLQERYRVPILVGPLSELTEEALKHGDHAPAELIPPIPAIDTIAAHLASARSPAAAQAWRKQYLAAMGDLTAAAQHASEANAKAMKANTKTTPYWFKRRVWGETPRSDRG